MTYGAARLSELIAGEERAQKLIDGLLISVEAAEAELAQLRKANEQLFEHGCKMFADLAALRAQNEALRIALREIAARLDSAAAEVDCFNVYESRDLARAALAERLPVERERPATKEEQEILSRALFRSAKRIEPASATTSDAHSKPAADAFWERWRKVGGQGER